MTQQSAQRQMQEQTIAHFRTLIAGASDRTRADDLQRWKADLAAAQVELARLDSEASAVVERPAVLPPATVDELRREAEQASDSLARLQDEVGTLEAEQRTIETQLESVDLSIKPATLAAAAARRDQLARVLEKKRHALRQARQVAQNAGTAATVAEGRLRDAQRALDRLLEARDGEVTMLTIRDWRRTIESKRRAIRELSGEDLDVVELVVPPLEGH